MSHIGTPISAIGMFDSDDMSFNLPRLTSNLALRAGSSMHGKALRASVGWNWVMAKYLKGEQQ